METECDFIGVKYKSTRQLDTLKYFKRFFRIFFMLIFYLSRIKLIRVKPQVFNVSGTNFKWVNITQLYT